MTRQLAFRARWVVPVDAPPIERGVVAIVGDRIAAVGAVPHGVAPIDLGEVALLPGFVNAHTHLELSDVPAPLGQRGMSLPEWIGHVIGWRRDHAGDVDRQRNAVRRGLAESLAAGVTTLGDIVQADWPRDLLHASPIRTTAFLELIGLSAERAEQLGVVARNQAMRDGDGHWRAGLSPHAPYSVRASVIEALPDLPLAMHVAESREELELLADDRGPFRTMLERLGAWQSGSFGGRSPSDYVRLLADRPGNSPALVVHGNYLTADAWSVLAAKRQRMSVVYCPRTHAYFGHERYPLAELWRRGVRVAVGTDSRASNPDLSVLEELRYVAREFASELERDMPRDEALRRILAMGTADGAAALGYGFDRGGITVGKRADLAVVRIDAAEQGSVYEHLLLGRAEAVATIAGGQVEYDPASLIRG